MLIGVVVGFFRGDPNPHFFEYPTLYLYFLAGVYCLFYARSMLAGWVRDSAGFAASFKVNFVPFFLAARATAAVLGGATVALVHAIARPLFGVSAGLLAAMFMAVAFLHVRDSHYATTDVPMVFFVMAAMLAIVRVHCYRRAFDARLAGVLAGCAMGVKYNAVILVLPMAIVEGLHAWQLRGDWRRMLRETHLFRMAAGCVLMFLAGSPYLLLDHAKALQDLRSLQASTSMGMTPPELLGRGWTYHLPHSLWYGVGWPMLFSALAGMVWMAARHPGVGAGAGLVPGGLLRRRRGRLQRLRPLHDSGGAVPVHLRRILRRICGERDWPDDAAAPGAGCGGPGAGRRGAAGDERRQVRSAADAGRQPDHRRGAGWPRTCPRARRCSSAGIATATRRWTSRATGSSASTTAAAPSRPIGGRPASCRSGWSFSARRSRTAHVPEPVEELIARGYQLAHMVRAYSPEARNFYDVQDGFYLPFGSFDRRRETRTERPDLSTGMRRRGSEPADALGRSQRDFSGAAELGRSALD